MPQKQTTKTYCFFLCQCPSPWARCLVSGWSRTDRGFWDPNLLGGSPHFFFQSKVVLGINPRSLGDGKHVGRVKGNMQKNCIQPPSGCLGRRTGEGSHQSANRYHGRNLCWRAISRTRVYAVTGGQWCDERILRVWEQREIFSKSHPGQASDLKPSVCHPLSELRTTKADWHSPTRPAPFKRTDCARLAPPPTAANSVALFHAALEGARFPF